MLLCLLVMFGTGFQTATEAELYSHAQFLANDLLEGRETGHRGQKLAAEYIASQFYQHRLEPLMEGNEPFFQSFTLYGSENDMSATQIETPHGRFGVDTGFRFIGSHPKPKRFPLEGIFIGYGIHSSKNDFNDYAFEEGHLEGKFIFVVDGYPPQFSLADKNSEKRKQFLREKKLKWAYRSGAAGMVILPWEDFGLKDWRPEGTSFPQHNLSNDMTFEPQEPTGTDFPVVEILPGQAKQLLGDYFEQVKAVIEKIGTENKPHHLALPFKEYALETAWKNTEYSTENVLALLPGSDPQLKEEVIVISVHYDHLGVDENHIHNGADDNASGTALMLALIPRLKEAQPKRSIMFLAVTAEEKGLLGSKFFIKYPPIPIKRIVANINVDMVGRNAEDEIGIIPATNGDVSTLLEIAHKVNQALDHPFKLNEEMDAFNHRSDHYNFIKADIPAVFFFSGTHEDYHKPSDTVDKLNFHKIAKVLDLITGITIQTANHPEPPTFLAKDAQKPGGEGESH